MSLTAVPQLRALYEEADDRLSQLESFMSTIETTLADTLRAQSQPTVSGAASFTTPAALVEAISAAKVSCVETAIDLTFRLKQEVGSYALMAGSGFERLDYLNCCKFAEGDSRILMQKISRDKVGAFRRALKSKPQQDATAAAENQKAPLLGVGGQDEVSLCRVLAQAMAEGGQVGWDAHWEDVYSLARVSINHTIEEWTGKQLKLGTKAKARL